MRYDKRVTLAFRGDSAYNPDTGKTEEPEQIIYTDKPCHRSPLSPQRTAVTFGNVQRDVSTHTLAGASEGQNQSCLYGRPRVYRCTPHLLQTRYSDVFRRG